MLVHAAASYMIHDFKKKLRFWGWGDVKFITEDNFILVTTKITTVNEKIVFYLSAFNSS